MVEHYFNAFQVLMLFYLPFSYHESGILNKYSQSYFGMVANNSKLQEKFVHINLENINSCKLNLNFITENNLKMDPVNNSQLLDVSKVFIVCQTFYSGKVLVRVNVSDKTTRSVETREKGSDKNNDLQRSNFFVLLGDFFLTLCYG